MTNTKATQYIRVITQFEALHRWPGAPDEESYLRHEHRHLFTVDVRLEVHHNDRELEINAFKRWLDRQLPQTQQFGHLPNLNSTSCEMIAGRIARAARETFGPRGVTVEVLEDGILGGGVALQGRWKKR